MQTRPLAFLFSGTALLGISVSAWAVLRPRPLAKPTGQYIAKGYGGYQAPKAKAVAPLAVSAASPAPVPSPEPRGAAPVVSAARAARRAGFARAKEALLAKEPALKKAGFEEAREHFAQAQAAETEPERQAEAAYQKAVCTAAAGETAQAEQEFIAVMQDYPTSPQVQAAIKRIQRLHGGDAPPEAEAAWKAAMATQKEAQDEQKRLLMRCGPGCLQELLRRARKPVPTLEALAKELKTNTEGTSLLLLREGARRHGWPQAEGVSLSAEGLKAQKLPLIALLAPGHYVLVEAVKASGDVTVWDPQGEGARRTMAEAEWTGQWQGAALVLTMAANVKGTK